MPDANEQETSRTEQIRDALAVILESQKIEEPGRTLMNWTVREEHVTKAIRLSKKGSATGMDG